MWYSMQNWMWPFFGPFINEDGIYIIPEGTEYLLDIAAWLVSVFTAIAIIYLLYQFIPKKIINTRIKLVSGICVGVIIGILVIAAMRYLIMDFFLGSVSNNYFEAMFLHELISASEWVFGFASLILLLAVIIFSRKISKPSLKKIYLFCGIGCLLFAVAIPILWAFGIPVDDVYGFPTQIVSVIGLLFGAAALLPSGKIVAEIQ